MSEFYDIDSTRVSHREYWWGTKSPLVLLGWMIKWLHIRIPSSTDDPNVHSTLSFVTESLPPEVAASFQPLAIELAALGFSAPICHVIVDPGTRTTIYWATFLHASGKHFARIHYRIWQQAQKPSRALFPMFFTEFADGSFLVSSAGKPDMTAPDTVQMNRMHGASVPELWAAHERLAEALSGQKMLQPVTTREDLLAASERHHVLMRDFHLQRGVFRQRSSEQQAKADAFAARVAQAQASGQEHAEVLAEVERLQEQKPGWSTAIWVLVGSLAFFLAAGAAKWDWKFTLWILPVLLFHESGHWVAMRLFHYRNLRMFFIPLFGAAVTGQNWNVAGWKKALVSLAGPLPGIGLGIVCGVLGLVLKHNWLTEAALALLFINALNLLPLLPLDGGHVLQDILFCRNRWLDGAFRVLAIFGLAAWGLFLGGRLMFFVAIPMAISLPLIFRIGQVTDELRQQTLPPPLPGEDRIPAPTAQAIINALRAALPAKATVSNKMLAQHTVMVFERLNARPPGVFATLCLLALHGGTFLAALVVAIVLVVSQQGGLGEFARAAIRQPAHSYQPARLQTWPAQSQSEATAPRTLIVTTFKNHAAASTSFASFTNRLPRTASLTCLCDSLLLSLPAGDDSARERWFDELQACSTNTFVALSNAPVSASLTFLATTASAATNLSRELTEYFATASQMHLVAPWSPEAKQPNFEAWRRARHGWLQIGREQTKVWQDPALEVYSTKIEAARKRGAMAEVERLATERRKKVDELQAQRLQQLRTDPSTGITPTLVELHVKLSSPGLTNRVERKALLREVAGTLGEVPYLGTEPAPGADKYGVTSGFATHHGLLVEVRWVGFYDVTQGLPAMAHWLWDQGCRQIKYDLEGSSWSGSLSDLED